MENLNHKFNNFNLKSKPQNNLNTLDDYIKKFQNTNIYNKNENSKQIIETTQTKPMKIDKPYDKLNPIQQKQICKPRHKSKLKPIIYMNVDVEPGMCQGITFINKKATKCKNKCKFLIQGKFNLCYQHKNQKICY